MEVEMYSYWNNAWVRYINDYFKEKENISINWHIGGRFEAPSEYNKKIGVIMWANEHAEFVSKCNIKIFKKTVVFIRSYEIFSGFIQKINWKNIDLAVFCNKSFLEVISPQIACKSIYIPNAINLDEWKPQKHYRGYNIAMVCHLNHKKGISMVPQVLYELNKIDKRYNIHIAGAPQQTRHIVYMNHILKQMGLRDRVITYNHINDIQGWLDDKDYLLTTSVTEGHPNNVLEAMSLGIKPVIHNWIGCKHNFPENLIWTGISEAVDLITNHEYDSMAYRKFVEDHYSHKEVYKKIEKILEELDGE
jgi:glycosyltransferase involved in cell wall biosynthesis